MCFDNGVSVSISAAFLTFSFCFLDFDLFFPLPYFDFFSLILVCFLPPSNVLSGEESFKEGEYSGVLMISITDGLTKVGDAR